MPQIYNPDFSLRIKVLLVISNFNAFIDIWHWSLFTSCFKVPSLNGSRWKKTAWRSLASKCLKIRKMFFHPELIKGIRFLISGLHKIIIKYYFKTQLQYLDRELCDWIYYFSLTSLLHINKRSSPGPNVPKSDAVSTAQDGRKSSGVLPRIYASKSMQNLENVSCIDNRIPRFSLSQLSFHNIT